MIRPPVGCAPILGDWREARCESLPLSGSPRRLFRLQKASQQSVILVDAQDDEPSFLSRLRATTDYLLGLGLRVPRLYAWDERSRCALVEDLGENCYARCLQERGAESCRPLFERALGDLVRLALARPLDNLPAFSAQGFVEETAPFLDHFMRADSAQRKRWHSVWHEVLVLGKANVGDHCFCLGDVHIENLFAVEDSRCAFIDFHDARLAPRGYDVVCLLEDGLWSMPEPWRVELWAAFCRETALTTDSSARYELCALHRSLFLIGVLYRLLLRDGGTRYAAWLLRMMQSCAVHVEAFPPLRAFFARELSDWQTRITHAVAVADSR